MEGRLNNKECDENFCCFKKYHSFLNPLRSFGVNFWQCSFSERLSLAKIVVRTDRIFGRLSVFQRFCVTREAPCIVSIKKFLFY